MLRVAVIPACSEFHTKHINCVGRRENSWFLGTLAKLRTLTTIFVMSVCPSVRPSVRMEQLGFHWADFREI
jgi:hypothetical protein